MSIFDYVVAESKRLSEKQALLSDSIQGLEDIIKIQVAEPSNKEDEYMRGLTNGLLVAKATVTDNEDPLKLMGPDGEISEMATQAEIDVANKTSRNWETTVTMQYVQKHVDSNASILDFGCGKNAKQVQALRADGFDRVEGYDFGSNAGTEFHNPKALSRKHDVTYASNVLNVQSSPAMMKETLKQMFGATKDGGKVIANYPSTPRYMKNLSSEALERLLKKYGSVERVGGYSAPIFVVTKGTKESVSEEVASHDHSNTQIPVPHEIAEEVLAFGLSIPDEEIYTEPDDPSMGREITPHITIKWGLVTENPNEVESLIEDDTEQFTVTLGKVSIFSKEDKPYDVVKVDVRSEELERLHNKFSSLKNDDENPKYAPHMTIAYVTKGAGQKYIGRTEFEGKQFLVDCFDFKDQHGNSKQIILNGGN